MEWLKWQESLINDFKDLDILEVITVRGAGKTWGAVGWVCDNSDVGIIFTSMKGKIKDLLIGLDVDYKEVYIVSSLEELEGLSFQDGSKIKVAVDDYFYRSEVNLQKLDEIIGHDKYKVLFIGSRITESDKFKIPYSKQLYVDIMQLFADKVMTVEQLRDVLSELNDERLRVEFGTPFESN